MQIESGLTLDQVEEVLSVLRGAHWNGGFPTERGRRNLDPGFIGATVVQALLQLETELRAGALLTVEEASTRVRLLPLNRDE